MVRCLTLLVLAGCHASLEAIDADGDGFAAVDDCDDDDDALFPGAPETCDGRDEDCDGEVDEAPSDAPTWYPDDDADGWGDDHRALTACEAPLGAVALGGDCDDTREAAHPGAPEACDGLDDDCDGAVDLPVPADAPAWFPDADGDGWGAPEPSVASCAAPEGHVATGTDCDDADGAIHPEAVETCDGRDEDCDGATDEDDDPDPLFFLDADGDGYGESAVLPCEGVRAVPVAGDCDDTEPAVNPGASEVCENRRDDDCDGTVGPCRWGVNLFNDGETPPHSLRVQGPEASYDFGRAIIGGEDFDGDGVEDVLVKSPTDLWIVAGPGSRTTGTAALYRSVPDAIWGAALAHAGDFDGDGTADYWLTESDLSVAVYRGRPGSEPPHLDLWTGSAYVGMSPRADDVSGDGNVDAIIGVPYGPAGDAVYLVHGPKFGRMDVTSAADGIIRGTSGDLGDWVSVIGDASGDGLAEVAVSDPYSGRTYVFESPTLEGVSTGDAAAELTGPGLLRADGGDVDGDGYADVLVGAAERAFPKRGYVYLFLGPFAGTRSYAYADATVVGDDYSELGGTTRVVGDLDGNGTADALVSARLSRGVIGYWEECVYLALLPLYGTHSPAHWDGYCSYTLPGTTAVAAIADFDHDGFDDFAFHARAVVEPGAGSVYFVFGTGW